MTGGRGCLCVMIGLWLTGCAELADPPEEAYPVRSSPHAEQEKRRIRSVVLPVVNATGRALRLAPDLSLGLYEPIVSPRDSAPLTVPDLVQAGFILALEETGRQPAGLTWINERLPEGPISIEAAWRLATDQQMPGTVVWISLTGWDDLAWRQRSIIRVSAEVVLFEPGRADSLRAKTFERHPFVIPPLSTLAQAAGHIGMRLASLAVSLP